MKTSDSDLPINEIVSVDCADLYFIDNIVIVEVKAHKVLGKNEVIPILDAIVRTRKDLSNVHYISNRTEEYSLKPTEFSELKERIDQFQSYSVVTYGDIGRTNLVFERMFLKREMVNYDSIEAAVKSIRPSSNFFKNSNNLN